MRITDNIINDGLQDNNSVNRDKYLYQMMKVSSGKKYLQRSDDTTATAQLARAEASRAQNAQWGKNAETALGFCTVTDTKIKDTLTTMHRLSEILVSANDGTQPPEFLKGLANEVDSMLESIYQTANAKDANGVYLFGGTDTAANPFTATRDASGKISAVSYDGNPTTRRKVQTGDNPNIDNTSYGVLGGGAGGLFIATGATPPVDIMGNLIALRDTLSAGTTPSAAELSDAGTNLDHVIQSYVDNGVAVDSIGTFIASTTTNDQYMEKVIAMGDLDMASAISEMTQMQSAYQASLQVTGKLYSFSILNYI